MQAPPFLDADLACGVAVGLVEHPRLVANRNQVTVLDPRGQTAGRFENWLTPGDPLHDATRAYLEAREEAQRAGSSFALQSRWQSTSFNARREQANQRALAARDRARQLLQERGVLARAQGLRLRVLA